MVDWPDFQFSFFSEPAILTWENKKILENFWNHESSRFKKLFELGHLLGFSKKAKILSHFPPITKKELGWYFQWYTLGCLPCHENVDPKSIVGGCITKEWRRQ